MAALRWFKPVIALILAFCSCVTAQEPFISYNKTIPIGESGFVRWDLNSFASPVNLWLQELAPNASASQVPLDYGNTKGFFLWVASGTNLDPGQFFYQLQSVGGSGVIFKSNPLMVVCSECPAETSSPPTTTSTDTNSETQPTTGLASTQDQSPDKGVHLSPGAAAGIGAGGSLLLILIILGLIYLLRRRRKRKQSWKVARPGMAPSSHSPSFTLTSPASHSLPAHDRSQQNSFTHRPSMAVTSGHGSGRVASHELDSAGMAQSPPLYAEQPRSEHTASRQTSWHHSVNNMASQHHHSPPLPSSRDGFQYRHPSHIGRLSSNSGQRAPGNSHENGSYGFPSYSASPNLETEGVHFQEASPQSGGSLDSQQYLIPRRVVASPNMRSDEGSQ